MQWVDGFQSSLLFSVSERGGIVGTPTRQFVQILHTGGNHWVTASNLFATSLLKIMRFAFMTASQQCWTAILNRPYHGC